MLAANVVGVAKIAEIEMALPATDTAGGKRKSTKEPE
jgi:hypothetical protein